MTICSFADNVGKKKANAAACSSKPQSSVPSNVKKRSSAAHAHRPEVSAKNTQRSAQKTTGTY